LIQRSHANGEVIVTPEKHTTNGDQQLAIRHMFFVKYVPHKTGQLMIADLNHLGINRKQIFSEGQIISSLL
jgi:hypothetical protein